MDHKSFMASLPPEQLAQLSRRADWPGLRHLAGHLGLIGLCGVWIGAGWPLWWILVPVQGVLIAFLFTLEHECTHKTPFASERLNEVIGHGCGFVLLLPFTWFRYFHLAHHRWTNLPGKDPELESPKPETWPAWILHVSGLPVWVQQARELGRQVTGDINGSYIPNRARPKIQREARWMCLGYALVGLSLLVSPLLFWVWLLPSLLGQPVLRIYLLAEHGRCPQVADMFDNTRTTFTNRIVRFIAWNMPFHVEHHSAPQIPFHQLPTFHGLIRDHLRHTSKGYRQFTAAWIAKL